MYLTKGKFTERSLNPESVNIIKMEISWGEELNKIFKQIYGSSIANVFPNGAKLLISKKSKKK